MKKFVSAYQSHGEAAEALSGRISSKWNVHSSDDVHKLMHYPLGKNYVGELLRGNSGGHPLIARLIAVDAMPADRIESDAEVSSSAMPWNFSETVGDNADSAALYERLNDIFVDIGVSPTILSELVSCTSTTAAATVCGVRISQINRVLEHPEGGRIIEMLRATAGFKESLRKKRVKFYSSDEKRRDSYRLRLVKWMKELSVSTRREANYVNFEMMRWLRQNDHEWLDEILPVRKPHWKRHAIMHS
ncbi:hypothetical protein [Rhodoferax sp.]|uniref:hypothetical protein n=1 Tax=Rhodoferax sp. TaxID=50421 RepID=UPI00271A1AD4|nr:hypothetical protein [Rhodoferax sp.]MDO9195417.1 hypothetical protein [Rhodoferax sp.]